MGTEFFIILSGSVGVNIILDKGAVKPGQASNPADKAKPKNPQPSSKQKSPLMSPGKVLEKGRSRNFDEDDKFLSEQYARAMNGELDNLTEVKVLREGDSFGEIALLKHKNSKRTATIIGKQDTHLAYLVRNDFVNALRDVEVEK